MKLSVFTLPGVALAAAVLLLGSCAEDVETKSTTEYEQIAFDAWMKQHRPDLVGNRQEGNGYHYYVDVLDAGVADSATVAKEDCWVAYEFTGRDLSGNVCMTRNARIAKEQGTFTKYTHYVPYLRFSGASYTTMLEGSYYALRNELKLSPEYIASHPDRNLADGIQARYGTELVLYLPSSLAYSAGTSDAAGYGGQFSLDAAVPVILQLKVTGRRPNPLAFEGELVDNFAKENGGLNPIEKEDDENKEEKAAMLARAIRAVEEGTDEPVDYVWYNAVDTVPQVYLYHTYFPSENPDSLFKWPSTYVSGYAPYETEASLAEIDKRINRALLDRFGKGTMDGDSLKTDESVNLWYICRQMDGFVTDTNIDEVKKIVYGEVATEGTALKCTVSETLVKFQQDNSLITSFFYSLPQLRYGQWVTMITTSSFAYGASGKEGGSTTSGGSSESSNAYLNYLNMMNMYSYYNNYMGGMYNSGYYGGYYGDYYGGMYGGYPYGYGYPYNYGTGTTDGSGDTTPSKTTYSTEIPAYAPLLFQIFIEPKQGN